MILDALIAQCQQRFQHEKRARVCLWFDDKGEFAPLLPAFRAHLSAIQPSPFVLLEYDPDAYHGQIDRNLKGYDFSVQAINLHQAKEGAETAVAFFISMVSSILDKPVSDRTVVLGEMSVQGLLLKVNALPERMQLAVEAGARRILIPSENKRDLADVPDAILTAIQWQFYDSPTKAAIIAMGMN